MSPYSTELRQGVNELEHLINPTTGEARIGCNETLAAGYVSAVTDRLSRQYPKVVFHLVTADRATLINRELRQRTVELIVTATGGLDLERDTEVEPLFDDRFVVMAGTQSEWAKRRKLDLADLIDEPWVLPARRQLAGDKHLCGIPRERTAAPRGSRGVILTSAAFPFAGDRAVCHGASGIHAAVQQTFAAQNVTYRDAARDLFDWNRHVEESNAWSIGAAVHRLRPRVRQAIGESSPG